MEIKYLTFFLCISVFVLFGMCLCPPTTRTTSAKRWKSPCHSTGVSEAIQIPVSSTDVTDQSLASVVVTYINEIKDAVNNLANRFTQTQRISGTSASSVDALIQHGQVLNGFPNMSVLRSAGGQQPETRNASIKMLSLHVREDYQTLSVMAVYIEQALKDEQDIQEWKPKWLQIKSKLLTILCTLQKCLTLQEQQIVDHVSHDILDDCTERNNCRTLTSLADKYNRDYMVLRTMSSIFEIMLARYQSNYVNFNIE